MSSRKKVTCSLCHAVGSTKATCPLNSKAKNKNYSKHNVTKKKPTIKKFKNPYTLTRDTICGHVLSLMEKIRINDPIITGYELKSIGYNIKKPAKIQITINQVKAIYKVCGYLQLLCDIYKNLASFNPTRSDFFTNPTPKVNKSLNLLNNTYRELISYLLTFINPSGGGNPTPGEINLKKIDSLLNKANKSNISYLKQLIPKAPTKKVITKKVITKKKIGKGKRVKIAVKAD